MRVRATCFAWMLVTSVAAVLAAVAPRAAAQCATCILDTGSTQFGQSLDIDGDAMALGDGSQGWGGVVFVMRRAEFDWKTETSVFSPSAEGAGRFGDAVAIDGEWLAVGAPGENGGAGAVHVFRRVCDGALPCTWVWQVRLLPAAGAPQDRFGTALALEGPRLLASSPGADLVATDAGAALVFERAADDTWAEVQTLLTTDGPGAAPGAGLGSSVTLAGDLAVLGSKAANVVSLFERGASSFGPPQALTLPDTGNFGMGVATDGLRVLVGSPGTNATTIKSGAAHVFESSGAGWSLAAKLEPPASAGSALFSAYGTAVALQGPTAIVGAPGAAAGNGQVHVYHLEPAGWELAATLADLPGPDSKGLGVVTALDGDTLAGGARAPLGPPGVVYTFESVTPWTELGGAVAAGSGASSVTPALDVDGSLCPSDALVLRVLAAKPLAPALVVLGLEATPLPWKGGVLWPRPDLVIPLAMNASGQATLTLLIPPGQPSAQLVVAQAWIADVSAAAGLAATPAWVGVTP